MATQWYYQSDDDERGPVGFSDLVQMICDEVLSEDDLVRPAYQSEWQHVDSVPGLLHMARRKQRQEATGNRKEATGNRQQATGNRQQATGKSSDEDVIAEVIEGAVGAGGSEQIDRSDWSWFDWLFYYLVPDWLVASRAPPVSEFSSEKLKDWQPASDSEPGESLNQALVQGSERPGRVSEERVRGGSRRASVSAKAQNIWTHYSRSILMLDRDSVFAV